MANACGTTAVAQPPPSTNPTTASRDQASAPDTGLRFSFARNTGDLDAMVKRGRIRALVLYSRSGFFYVNGRPEGIYYEALQAFEQFLNQKLHTRRHVQVTFIPVRPDQIEKALTDGVGDMIAYGLAVRPRTRAAACFFDPDSDWRETDRRDTKKYRSAFIAGGSAHDEGLRESADNILREPGKDK